MSLALRVLASGLCCALGYRAAAACCALRAGLDAFEESEFVADDGAPVRVARLPDTETWGGERLANWVRYAVADCIDGIADFAPAHTALVLLTLEPQRPHGDEHTQLGTAITIQEVLGMQFHPRSCLIPGGRAGLARALAKADALLAEPDIQQVLLVGADSLLNAASIGHYLAAERLLVRGNRDGFLPGEAAAAVLLAHADPEADGLLVLGLGRGQAAGRPDGSVPSRARGLTQALRAALAQAGVGPEAIGFRLSDQNGEGFFAREAANAFTRIAPAGAPSPAVLTTADCTGEIGAATGVLMLVYLTDLLGRGHRPGRTGIIHLANDHGARAAVFVRHNP